MSQGIEMCVQCAIMTQFIKYVTAVCHISHHNNKNPCSSQKGKREEREESFHIPQSTITHASLISQHLIKRPHTSTRISFISISSVREFPYANTRARVRDSCSAYMGASQRRARNMDGRVPSRINSSELRPQWFQVRTSWPRGGSKRTQHLSTAYRAHRKNCKIANPKS